MVVLNWIVEHWSLVALVLTIGVAVARHFGWAKVVKILTFAIERGESLDPRTANAIKAIVAGKSDKRTTKKLQKFIVDAEERVAAGE